MYSLSPSDLNFVVRRLPADVRTLVKQRGLYVGGGFIREAIAGGEIKDIDLFGASKSLLFQALDSLTNDRRDVGQRVRFISSDNAYTLLSDNRLTVQAIHRWTYENADNIISDFDFTVCAAAIWFDGTYWQSRIHKDFYADLAARRLVYTSPQRTEDAGGSLLRVLKFVKRGYNIQTGSLGKVVSRLVSGIKDHGDYMSEERRGEILTGLLREVDPNTIVDGIEPVDPHDVETGVAVWHEPIQTPADTPFVHLPGATG